MTEEIIINGVDVAGCENYCVVLKDMCAFGGTKRCSQIHNCYYKQLTFANKKLEAAKAETEKLVSTIWIMSGEITDLRNEKERLHNELIEAKSEQLGTLIRYNKILEGIKEYIDSNYGLTTFHIQDIVNIINEVLK